jgi:large subunit ribosomal protein L20
MRARKGHARRKARKRLFAEVKGNWGRRSHTVKMAFETLIRARQFAFAHRRLKKRDFRSLWITRVSAACEQRGISYSRFIHGLAVANVELNRKSMSELAIHVPHVFDELVKIAREHATTPVAATA